MEHEVAYIALAEMLGARSRVFKPLITRFRTPEAVFSATKEEIAAVLPHPEHGFFAALDALAEYEKKAARIAFWCHRNGVRVLTPDGDEYPESLFAIDEPPVVLYCRGKLPAKERQMTLGVVGPRHPDAYGEKIAYRLSFELAAAGMVIVSGMAEGIDGIAAAAAVSAGGQTVAVFGCGVDIAYPRHHAHLADEIAAHGAVLSEFAPGTKPTGENFPIRNRLISALSQSVLIPEAGERSGALITARYALLQGKRLFAVPGDITDPRSKGSNRLLAGGAMMALCAEDILSQYRFLYHDLIDEKSFLEAEQSAELTEDVARRFGLRLSEKRDTSPTQKEGKRSKARKEKAPRARRQREEREDAEAPGETDLSILSARQRELFSYLPDAPFTVDALTERGVPVSEAAATLTVFEIYGLISPLPGGVFAKK